MISIGLFMVTPLNSFADETKVTQMEVPVCKCSEPVKKIVISEIECKASGCQEGGGQQVKGLLNLADLPLESSRNFR